ncbi:thiol-disulfide oxidoreductase DCC family protein [Bacillus sp. AK128]
MKTPIVFFDGECNLCNGAVQFLLKHDRKEKLKFASLQSNAGQKLLQKEKLDAKVFDSMIMTKDDKVFVKSDAVLAICRELGGSYKGLLLLYAVPRPIRNFFYTIIARNRYKWFGKRDQCMIPTPELKKRFLD